MSEIDDSERTRQEATPDAALGGSPDDIELLQALETLRRVVGRPKRAPRGTNDVWGWSTGQEHAIEPGTEPREQVVERIRKSYAAPDGSTPAGRTEREVAVLETIALVLDNFKDRPEYAQHDLKRIVKALEAVVSDRVGPGDAPPEPSKMLVGPGEKSRRQIAEDLAKPVLTPEEETLDYSYIVSDHPAVAALVKEHGLTTIWSELLRLRFDLPIKNPDIASTLSKVTLAMDGSNYHPDVPAIAPPKMYVDEKGEPVMYDRSRSTDIFPLELFWQDVDIVGKEAIVQSLTERMDRSGRRRPGYASVRDYGKEVTMNADIDGDRAVWLELMRIRYGVWPKDEQLNKYLRDLDDLVPTLFQIPPGEEAVPPRLVADVRLEIGELYRMAHKIEAANKKALERRKLLESGELGAYVRLSPWNTYVRLDTLTKEAQHASAAETAEGAAPHDDKTQHAIDSIRGIASEDFPTPTAGILADALRMAANQIEQQAGIAEAGITTEEAAEQPPEPSTKQPVVKVLKDEGIEIHYQEGRRAAVVPIWGPEEIYYRELVSDQAREMYKMDKWRAKQGNLRPIHEYKDGKLKEQWRGLSFLSRSISWDRLPEEGLAEPNRKYYPFTTDYVDYIKSMRTLALETFRNFKEAAHIREEKGVIGVLRQKWKDSAEGLPLRIWTGHQMFLWIHAVDDLLLRFPPDGQAKWDFYNQMRRYEPTYSDWISPPDGMK